MIFGRTAFRFGDMILAIRDNRHDAALAQFTAMRLAVVALVQTQSFRSPPTLANVNTVNGRQQLGDVIAICFAQSEVQWMTIGINHQVSLQAFDPVFSRVSDLVVCPLLDLITLAS